MPTVDRRWLPPVFIALAAIASVAALGRLPSMVEVPIAGLLPFDVTPPPGPAPRGLALFLMPVLALIVWVGFRWAATAAGQRFARRMFPHAPAEVTSPGQFQRFGRTYEAIVLGVVLLVLGLHAAVLAAAFQAPAIASRLLPATLGACLLLIGNVMPRLRPNWVAGLRTRRMLADPQLWRSAHRAFGAAFVGAGIITILAAVLAPRYGLLVGIATLLASLVIGYVASTRGRGTTPHVALAALGLLWASASGVSAQMPQGATTPIELNAPVGVVELSFMFVRGSLTLDGTLALPSRAASRLPVVLIVAGSGHPQVQTTTYRDPSMPVAASVVPAIARWILAAPEQP